MFLDFMCSPVSDNHNYFADPYNRSSTYEFLRLIFKFYLGILIFKRLFRLIPIIQNIIT